jgi:hypothetical protein
LAVKIIRYRLAASELKASALKHFDGISSNFRKRIEERYEGKFALRLAAILYFFYVVILAENLPEQVG